MSAAVFILPLNLPSANGAQAKVFDDFTYDAVAWTPHGLTKLDPATNFSLIPWWNKVSRLLALSTRSTQPTQKAGGLYSEYLIKPYMPAEGQLASLDLRLLRAARAFLDPELQSGAVTPEQAKQVLMKDVVLSDAFASSEVERYTHQVARAGKQLLLRLQPSLGSASRDRGRARLELQCTSVSRLHPGSGAAPDSPHAKSRNRRVHSVTKGHFFC